MSFSPALVASRRQNPLLKDDFEDLLAKREKLLMKPIERKNIEPTRRFSGAIRGH